MAFLPATESDYDFVEKPCEDYFCPVTSDLLLEPCQTLCCGNHLSQEAVTRLQQDGGPCPICKKTLNTVPDLYFQRTIKQFKVHCPNKSLGCEWVGELGSLDSHLSQNSVEGECQFVTVACPYSCGNNLQRHQLEGHKGNDCLNRPFTCQYCPHEATYDSITNEHWSACERYPVECSNKSLGCQWAGDRGDLDQHLNCDSEEGECHFVKVICPYDCGGDFQRRQLEGHKANDCPKRPFTCQYCSFTATYNEVTSEHSRICKEHPLQCPNECGKNAIKRQDLSDHLKKNCPLQVIKCEFRHAGCRTECQRQQMQTHLDENVKVHLVKVSRENKQQQQAIQQMKRQIERLQFITEQQQGAIKQQYQEIDILQHTTQQQQQLFEQYNSQMQSMMSTLNRAATPTFHLPEVEMANFERLRRSGNNWSSPPFYSHLGGYKMCLFVDANGKGSGVGTHISVWIHLIRGEHDHHLKWPFRGKVTVQLLNQRRDEGHWEKIVRFDDTADCDVARKDAWWKRSTTGMGYGQFIAHSELNTEDKEYLHNDCLRFRISQVVVTNM